MTSTADLLTTAQVAAIFGVGTTSIHGWVARGVLPIAGTRPGRGSGYAFDPAAVDALLERAR
jgi:phage terminase Nu1 subunit (DNA packaging protein)